VEGQCCGAGRLWRQGVCGAGSARRLRSTGIQHVVQLQATHTTAAQVHNHRLGWATRPWEPRLPGKRRRGGPGDAEDPDPPGVAVKAWRSANPRPLPSSRTAAASCTNQPARPRGACLRQRRWAVVHPLWDVHPRRPAHARGARRLPSPRVHRGGEPMLAHVCCMLTLWGRSPCIRWHEWWQEKQSCHVVTSSGAVARALPSPLSPVPAARLPHGGYHVRLLCRH
jgi:hypothetical protein